MFWKVQAVVLYFYSSGYPSNFRNCELRKGEKRGKIVLLESTSIAISADLTRTVNLKGLYLCYV
jgi:hypothetical protein